jgi:DNA-binding NarL/FixJ family response regulator
MLRETKPSLTSVEASASQFPCEAPAADPARLRAKALQSLQTSMLAMIDFAVALEFHMAAPEAAIREIMHLSQSIDMASERLAGIAGPLRDGSSDVAAPTKNTAPIFPVAIRPVRKLGESQDDRKCLSATIRHMSPREIAVLDQLVKGLPNKLIAFELGISVVTVKAHIGAILRKMNVHSRNRVIAMLANVDISALRETPPTN